MATEIKKEEPQVVLEIPYISEDDARKLAYINNLLLREILDKIKEETDVTVQKEV